MPKLTEQLAAPLRQMQVRRFEHSRVVVLRLVCKPELRRPLLFSGVCEAHRQSLCRRQAGRGRGDVFEPVQASPDGRGLRLGQRLHVCTDLQDDGCFRR